MHRRLALASIVVFAAACGAVSGNGNGTTCAEPLMTCGDVCTNTDIDDDHCGDCDTVCAAGEACVGGTCTLDCQAGFTNCGGRCVDTDTDRDNCGGCGAAYTCSPGNICNGAGACELSCQIELTDCGGTCTNTNTDRLNCGGCGAAFACPDGYICNGAGACELTCVAGLTGCNGACVDTQTDERNCNFCGNPCAPGELCVAGVCQLPPHACTAMQAEHPGYTTVAMDVALCGNRYTNVNMPSACGPGWHVCRLSEWTARFPPGMPPLGTLTSWGAPQSARCMGGVWEADQPVSAMVWTDAVCDNPYNPWNNGKFLYADDGVTVMQGDGNCCSWDSSFFVTAQPDYYAVYCCN
jgi:hypothetical protein